uniref:Uncharacterized protein n=1 Tax=Anopheles minimus TaxID=112268 RepID=A0A182WNZ2_9DIPT
MRYGLSSAPEPAATPPSLDVDNFVRSICPTCLLYSTVSFELVGKRKRKNPHTDKLNPK